MHSKSGTSAAPKRGGKSGSESQGVYAFQQGEAIGVGNDFVEGLIRLHEGPRLASLTNKITGRHHLFSTSQECVLRLAKNAYRYDVPEWRFQLGSGDWLPPLEEVGYRLGFHLPDVDERSWAVAQTLSEFPVGTPGYSTVLYPGYGWYRHSFVLPSDLAGSPIALTLGGCDNQDWLEYWVYMNGDPVGYAAPAGYWHPAPRYALTPSDATYETLRFGQTNWLAIQARGLDRRKAEMHLSDAERYSVGSPLVDQVVSAGSPYRELASFRLLDHRETRDQHRAGAEIVLSDDCNDLRVILRYWVNHRDPILHKDIDVENVGADVQILLEVDVQTLTGDFEASLGGMGYPCTIADEVFCGIRHPAGLAQGERQSVTLRLFPGRVLQSSESYTSKTAVLGVGPAGGADAAFVQYLAERSPRKPELISIYDLYGLYDSAGMAEPTEVGEQMVLDNLDDLERLRRLGITFDYYYIDAGWSNRYGDLRDFDPIKFPDGPQCIVERVEELGMKFGLWMSPTSGPMAFHPEVKNAKLASCGTLPSSDETRTEHHRGTLCMAAEPWRTMFREALLHHVQENRVRGFKYDGNAFFCTNPEHGHLPGKYSIEPIMDAMVDALETVRRECPDIMTMYYWNIRSPWWLLYGDTIYERGILMEGATPSDFPTRLLRQSVTISLDQATYHAWNKVPLYCGDSLGVWISKWRWGNYMATEGWQDAWVMDIARGSMLCQLWGDIALFDDSDLIFLADTSEWLRNHASLLRYPMRILGDPWRAEPYGYAYFHGAEGALFIYNPRYEHQRVTLQLGESMGLRRGCGHSRFAMRCIFPRRYTVPLLGERGLLLEDTFDLHLAPFQVIVLQIDPVPSTHVGGAFPVVQVEEERNLALSCDFREVACTMLDPGDPATQRVYRRCATGRAQFFDEEQVSTSGTRLMDERDTRVVHRRIEGTLSVPPTADDAQLVIIARLSREGVYWHHHALYDIVQLMACVDGRELPVTHMPCRWHEQAGGWSWIQFSAPLAETHAPGTVTVQIDVYVPASVETRFEAWLFKDG